MTTQHNIGRSLRRIEDVRFLRGQGTYIDDINIEKQAYAFFIRSPHAHAIIRNIDIGTAIKAPGVLLITIGSDWIAEKYGPIPCKSAVNKFIDGSPMKLPPRHCFAIDRVRYVGEIVAMVIAETQPLAIEAAELVEVEYEELLAVIDPAEALRYE